MKNSKAVINVSVRPKMKTIRLRDGKIDKIIAKVHVMCRNGFDSGMGDAEPSEYEELEEMLRKI